MTYAEAIRYLYALEHGGVKLGLERIRAAVEARGHPERRYACVHVAGTNGKGSTCALLAAILAASGYRTGLFTSPHLLDFRERIRVAGALVSREDIAASTARLRPLIDDLGLSFFEATTLLAFEIFAARRVQIALIEVGMGGRLDATNVIRPALTVVTGIDLDHVQSLGRTRVHIAGEKAGIIKPGVPLLLGPCTPGVRRVFLEAAARAGAPLVRREERSFAEEVVPLKAGARYRRRSRGGGARGSGRERPADDGRRSVRLRGRHQVENALLAEEAAVLLAERGWEIPWRARREGLAHGRWPGRFQIVRRPQRGPAIFDVAHNPQGGGTLAAGWRDWFPAEGAPGLIVGMLGDKDHLAFFRKLRSLTDRLDLVALDSPRACPIEGVAAAARRAGFRPRVAAGMADAWASAGRGGRPVLVTGSFLTVEAGMRFLRMRPVRTLFPRSWGIGRTGSRSPARTKRGVRGVRRKP